METQNDTQSSKAIEAAAAKVEACEHGGEGWPLFEALPIPLDGMYKCSACTGIAYRLKRPSHRGHRRGQLKLYKCREKGCTALVVERRFGKGWSLVNGCTRHPITKRG